MSNESAWEICFSVLSAQLSGSFKANSPIRVQTRRHISRTARRGLAEMKLAIKLSRAKNFGPKGAIFLHCRRPVGIKLHFGFLLRWPYQAAREFLHDPGPNRPVPSVSCGQECVHAMISGLVVMDIRFFLFTSRTQSGAAAAATAGPRAPIQDGLRRLLAAQPPREPLVLCGHFPQAVAAEVGAAHSLEDCFSQRGRPAQEAPSPPPNLLCGLTCSWAGRWEGSRTEFRLAFFGSLVFI